MMTTVSSLILVIVIRSTTYMTFLVLFWVVGRSGLGFLVVGSALNITMDDWELGGYGFVRRKSIRQRALNPNPSIELGLELLSVPLFLWVLIIVRFKDAPTLKASIVPPAPNNGL